MSFGIDINWGKSSRTELGSDRGLETGDSSVLPKAEHTDQSNKPGLGLSLLIFSADLISIRVGHGAKDWQVGTGQKS